MCPDLSNALSSKLLTWYETNARDLPWRKGRDAYRIWISEVMLQQTTVVAVIPYFERFLTRFPTLAALAKAPLEDVFEMWAGLGYYSRARNLHKAAQALHRDGFPKTAAELIEFPGFGPYTSRAVASLAFDEPVGVLDGNVTRVLTRVFGLSVPWWNSKEREDLQMRADKLAAAGPPHLVNNALMELGAIVCTPANPTCLLCPWNKNCVTFKKGLTTEIPLKKPRKESEVWVWSPQIVRKGEKIAMVENNYAPFLKGQMIFPGTIVTQAKKPKTFDLKHGITHHDIYIQIEKSPVSAIKSKDITWIQIKGLKKINPSNLLQKVLSHTRSF